MQKRNIIRGILVLISIFCISGIYYYSTKATKVIEDKSIEVVKIQAEAISEYLNKRDLGVSLKTDTLIFGKDNKKIGHIYRNNYKYVEYKDISKEAIEAYKAVEDRRFDTHKGVDYLGILRAAKYNYNSGSTKQGGSTITQQLIKNSIVGKEKSYKRKLKEVFIAPILEQDKGKEWILERYLNTNFYGNGVYGIGYAANYYFGKEASELTYKEAALLIATTNGPSKYNPRTNPEVAFEKAKSNYKKIYEAGYIDEKTYNENVDKPYELVFKKPENTRTDKITTLALYDATLEMMKHNDFEFKFKFNSNKEEKEYKENYYKVYKETMDKLSLGGYRIYTNIDTNVYNETNKVIEEVLSKVDNEIEASTVVIDNKTQYLVAATGGRKDDEFNRAFQALRQPGSLVKALYVYPTAMETLLLSYGDYEIDEKIKGDYSPENVDKRYRGSVMLRDALANSINTIAYKLLDKSGLDNVSKTMTNYNIASTTYIDYFNPAISLGGLHRGWSPYEVAKGFSSIINNGSRCRRNIVTKITDENGNVVLDNGNSVLPNPTSISKENKEELKDILQDLNIKYSFNNLKKETMLEGNPYIERKIMEPETSQTVIDAMKYTVELPIGTAHSLKNIINIKDEYVAKTGTTTMSRDGWGVVMTPKYTVLTWVGYDQPKPAQLYGGTYPLTISGRVMNKLYENLGDYEKEKFNRDGIIKVTTNGNGLITYVTDDMSKDYGSIGIDSLIKRLNRDSKKYLDYNRKLEEEREQKEFEENYQDVNYREINTIEDKESNMKETNEETKDLKEEKDNNDKNLNVLSEEDIKRFEDLNNPDDSDEGGE